MEIALVKIIIRKSIRLKLATTLMVEDCDAIFDAEKRAVYR